MKHITYLKELRACREAVDYAAQFPTLQKAWDNCERGDWMLWLLGKQSGLPESASRKKLVLTTSECARLSLKYVPEDEKRPLIAIETAEKWARGDHSVSLQDVRNAAYAAYAYAATYAAAYAYAAAAYAAYAAVNAAYAYAVAYAAADAAYAANAKQNILKQCADIVRKDYPKIKILNPKP